MYFLRTHVFSKQEKKFMETAMAFACDFDKFLITASTASPRAVLPNRSILSRKLLLSSTAGKSELLSELWSRTRRRKFFIILDNCRPKKLLFKLQHQQYNRLVGSRYTSTSTVPRSDESIKERQSTRDIVSGNRKFIIGRRCSKQNISSSLSAYRLCSSSTSTRSRQRAVRSNSLSSLEMERPYRLQRDKVHTEMSQRKGSHLCVLQSSSLESCVPTR